ncbi:hypothetical protein [Phyllobacterium phragmitis]|uniref:Uncharacterized protein n=1 Tax=Phyllobacterium phragmitis TaxID=2670329 RepID=A0ABQ0H776_9HYPH
MSTDNNKLKLTINPNTQAADGHSKIKADATAYIDNGGIISYPDPPVEIVFELPEGTGATFEGSPTNTTSRKTLIGSGRIESPVYFYSDKVIENGTLKAYWKEDKENTLQQKTFTFTATSVPGFIKPTNNFAPADGSSTITLQVGLSGNNQEATITFSEKTGTVKFTPPSVQVQSGKTATTNATCNEPGAFFVTTEVGTVEIDFIAKGSLAAAELDLSNDHANPTTLTLANDFDEVDGWFITFYMLLPSFEDYTFSSLSFSSTSFEFGNTASFLTSDGSTVDPTSNDIAIPGPATDMTPMQYYVGAFYSKEKNLWKLYSSGDPIFGLSE